MPSGWIFILTPWAVDFFLRGAYGRSALLTSAVMYVQPHNEGGVTKSCKAKLFGFGTPTRRHSGAPVVNEVEVNRLTDEY